MKKVIIGDRQLSKEEKEQLYYCISARLGFIETGEVSLRMQDAINMGQHKKIKNLSKEQMELILTLEDIMKELI